MTNRGTVLILAIIAAIVYIEKMAIVAGFNGTILTTTLAALFGLAGSVLHKLFKDRKSKGGR